MTQSATVSTRDRSIVAVLLTESLSLSRDSVLQALLYALRLDRPCKSKNDANLPVGSSHWNSSKKRRHQSHRHDRCNLFTLITEKILTVHQRSATLLFKTSTVDTGFDTCIQTLLTFAIHTLLVQHIPLIAKRQHSASQLTTDNIITLDKTTQTQSPHHTDRQLHSATSALY